MYAIVLEQGHMHELTLGGVDHLGDGPTFVHWPWSARECQSVLIPWFTARWIEVIADAEPPWSLYSADWQNRATQQEGFLVLSTEDATALLNDPERWVLGTADGHAMLSPTREGQTHEYLEWLGLVEKANDGT